MPITATVGYHYTLTRMVKVKEMEKMPRADDDVEHPEGTPLHDWEKCKMVEVFRNRHFPIM